METIVPSPRQERAAAMMRALGNPVRLAIAFYILDHPRCICNDLVVRFGRAQATISQHLAILRGAELLECERDGHTTCYKINHAALHLLVEEMQRLDVDLSESSRRRVTRS